MEVGGNERARTFMRQYGFLGGPAEKSKVGLKYHSRAAELYREQIKQDASDSGSKKSATLAKLSQLSFDDEIPNEKVKTPENLNPLDSWHSEVSAAAATAPPKATVQEPSPTPVPTSSSNSNTSVNLNDTVSKTDNTSPGILRAAGTSKKPAKGKARFGAKKATSSAFDDFDTQDDTPPSQPVSSSTPASSSTSSTWASPSSSSSSSSTSSSKTSASSQTSTPVAYQPDLHAHTGFISTKLASNEVSINEKESFQSQTAPKTNSNSNSRQAPTNYDGDAQRRFAGAKSISSAQYFGEDQKRKDPENERRLSRFSGANSISSADYFERDETPEITPEVIARRIAYTAATTDLNQIKNVVVDGSIKFQNMASDFFNDLQTRYQ